MQQVTTGLHVAAQYRTQSFFCSHHMKFLSGVADCRIVSEVVTIAVFSVC